MAVTVSIIIVNHNSGEDIFACIESIFLYTKGIEYEVIVVDNGSTDGSLQNLNDKGTEYSWLKIIVAGNNLGFGAANNLGAKQAQGKYLLFLNPDTLLINDAVVSFYQYLDNSPADVVACGARLEKPDGEYAVSFGHFPTLLQQFSDIGFRILYKGYYNKRLSLSPPCPRNHPFQAAYISGADIFIRKEIFEKIGGFDESFFMYYEDTDLFYRLMQKGYQAWLLPEVRIIHKESNPEDAGGVLNYEKYRMLERSKYLFFRKHRGMMAVWLAKIFQVIALMVHWGGRYKYRLGRVWGITLKS